MMNKITRFRDIPQLTRFGNWQINISLADLPYQIKKGKRMTIIICS